MKQRTRAIILFTVCAIVLSAVGLGVSKIISAFSWHSVDAIVTSVYDGDTLTLMYIKPNALPTHIRLYSIDAPEIGDKGSYEARDELRYLALGKRVTVKHYNRLTYGRLLAYVEVDGLDLTAAMLRSDLVSVLCIHPEERHQYRR
jgi:endonuclease YncB( thermonuclease family)